jgi:hypothetical protein
MKQRWTDALSLMIEALSFREGNCYVKYNDVTEYKVKVAAMEAALRWSEVTGVALVADDFHNPDIHKSKRSVRFVKM